MAWRVVFFSRGYRGIFFIKKTLCALSGCRTIWHQPGGECGFASSACAGIHVTGGGERGAARECPSQNARDIAMHEPCVFDKGTKGGS